jgi:hypothetical protein
MKSSLLFFVTFLFTAPLAAALSPVDAPVSLLAGNGQPGIADGALLDARFDSPSGICFDAGGKTLVIADTGNHRLRSIDLRQALPSVQTLGGSTAGLRDGALDQALFDWPELLRPGAGGLLVLDQGGMAVRRVALDTRTVSTPYQGKTKIVDMVEGVPGELLVLGQSNHLLRISGTAQAQALTLPSLGYAVSMIEFRGLLYFLSDSGVIHRCSLAALSSTTTAFADLTPLAQTTVWQGSLIVAQDDLNGSFAMILDARQNRVYRLGLSGVASELQTYGIDGVLGPFQSMPRRSLGRLSRACYDPLYRRLYSTDTLSRRVLRVQAGLGPSSATQNHAGYNDFDHSPAPLPGFERLGVIGASLAFRTPGDDGDPAKAFPKRFELWLNALAGLMGCRHQYETAFYGSLATNYLTMPIRTGAVALAMKRDGVSEVFMVLSYHDLCDEGIGILLKGGRQVNPDPEWTGLSIEQKRAKLDPVSRELFDRLLAQKTQFKDYYTVSPTGILTFSTPANPRGNEYALLKDPKIRQLMLDLMNVSLQKAKEEIAAVWAADPAGPVPKINILHIPVRNILNMSESDDVGRDWTPDIIDDFLDGELARSAKSLGLGYISLTDETRLLSPLFNPVYVTGDNHPTRRGHDLFGFLAALQVLRKAGCASFPGLQEPATR